MKNFGSLALGSFIWFTVVFVVVYFVYYVIFNDRLKKEKYTKITELGFFVRKFDLDKKKMDYRSCLNGVALINAFIMSFVITLLDLLLNLVDIPIWLCLPIAFILLLGMIYGLYTAYGKKLNKKWGNKNGI